MEETLQQEKQETEGGIRRRLRDRDLLRKRKAEAEEKETNQWVLREERQRKRSADEKSGAKKRGRPRKGEPTLEIPVSQGEAASALEAPAVMGVVPVSMGVDSEQTSGSLTPLYDAGDDKPESQPESVPAAPASTQVLERALTSLYAPLLTSPAPVNQSPALLSFSVPAPLPTSDVDAALVFLPAPDAVPVPAPSQGPVPVPAPPQVETLCTEARDRDAFDQFLIKDVGPDEEEDLSLLQDKTADEDLTEPPSINIPEQDRMFSIPTLSSQPPPEYLPGNYSNL